MKTSVSEKPTILLVDDDRDIVRGVSTRLRAAGYEVLVAYDGRAGLTAASEKRPAAIVLDMRMPVMDGLAVLSKLRERPETGAIPVVVLSASVLEQDKTVALHLGARYFLEKPYEAPQLIQAVEAALRQHQNSSAPIEPAWQERDACVEPPDNKTFPPTGAEQ